MQQDTRTEALPTAGLSSDAADASDDRDRGQQPLITEEMLVEEISIDGMCGVY